MNLPLYKAVGAVKDNIEFSCRCPYCDLTSIVSFDRRMKLLKQNTCWHFVSYRLEKGSGVFFSFAKE